MNYKMFLFAIALACTGCSSSRITASWKPAAVVPYELKRVMVVGIIPRKDASLRRQMENHLADDLCLLGYDAVSSLDLYGPKSFKHLEEKEVLQQLGNDSIDAVLTIVLLDKEKEQYYVPGQVYYTPYAYYYNRYYPYYIAVYNRIYEEGYYVTDTRYFWESNLYLTESQTLLYSAQTESFDPLTTMAMAHEYGRLLVADMVHQGVLKNSNRK